MLHRTAKLTPLGRRLLVDRVPIEGWPAATAAEMLGVSRATAYSGCGGIGRTAPRGSRTARLDRTVDHGPCPSERFGGS
jgi:transposase